MKLQVFVSAALLCICSGAGAQSLIPKVTNSSNASKASVSVVRTRPDSTAASLAGHSAGTVSKAVYSTGTAVASTASKGVAPRAKTLLKASVPVADRERPAAKVSKAYDTRLRTNVHFVVSRTDLEYGYLDNSSTLKELKNFLDTIPSDKVSVVEIVSKASPEGPVALNESLAEGRAETVCSYIHSVHPELDNFVIMNPGGESWDELEKYVRRDQNLSQASKNEVLRAMSSSSPEERKRAMKSLGSDAVVGDIYKYLKDSYYVLIRNVAVYVTLKH